MTPGAPGLRPSAWQDRFVPRRAAWKKDGYDLELGIGVAKGYATLGVIGFDWRWDYACIGSVTNLAARLCSEAKGGQILINQKTLTTVEESAQVEPLGEITLKGVSQPVRMSTSPASGRRERDAPSRIGTAWGRALVRTTSWRTGMRPRRY